ncbi:MLO-like protein 9 [Salvia divinorum]|uniref:MLO-like protein 9 n=1 Tax=Salvia divinorum TaxID=28513 RepID=A0ABD1FNH0_SALDI
MAGGGGGGRELDTTPTGAVALVCLVIIVISIILEKTIHKTSHAFEKRRRMTLVEALEKIKGELMVLGFISLLLTFRQTYITEVCIPEKISRTMLPCEFKEEPYEEGGGSDAKAPSQKAALRRRLLSFEQRMLAGGGDSAKGCDDGFVPLISVSALHHLHIFIFFLAVFHVFYSAITMMLGRLKIRGWKDWERQIAEETDGTSGISALVYDKRKERKLMLQDLGLHMKHRLSEAIRTR